MNLIAGGHQISLKLLIRVCYLSLFLPFIVQSIWQPDLWCSLGFMIEQVLGGICGVHFHRISIGLLAFLEIATSVTRDRKVPVVCLIVPAVTLLNIVWGAYWWAQPIQNPGRGCPDCWQQFVVFALFAASIIAGVIALVMYRRRFLFVAAIVANSLWVAILSSLVALMGTIHQWI